VLQAVGPEIDNLKLSRPGRAYRMWPTVSFDPPSAGESRGKRHDLILIGSPGRGDRRTQIGRLFLPPLPGLVRPRAHDPMAYAMGHILSPLRA
jgi:hypothetical protein